MDRDSPIQENPNEDSDIILDCTNSSQDLSEKGKLIEEESSEYSQR